MYVCTMYVCTFVCTTSGQPRVSVYRASKRRKLRSVRKRHCVCVCVCVCMYLCIIYVSMYLCMYVSMYVRMYVQPRVNLVFPFTERARGGSCPPRASDTRRLQRARALDGVSRSFAPTADGGREGRLTGEMLKYVCHTTFSLIRRHPSIAQPRPPLAQARHSPTLAMGCSG